MNATNLKRVCLEQAEAVIILANRTAKDPDTEDGGNILRVISIKNYCGNIRIILQILSYQNKRFLFNIPNWDQMQDEAICINELRLGFLAQSCLAPGFPALLSNMFYMVSAGEGVRLFVILICLFEMKIQ